MAFDFPAAPAVDDEYTIGGIVYAWDGAVWAIKGGGDPQDYVLKAGDVMTGPLGFGNADYNITLSGTNVLAHKAPTGGTHQFHINDVSKAQIDQYIRSNNGGNFVWNNTDNNVWQTAFQMNGGIFLQYHQGGNNDGRLRIWTSNGGYSDAYVLETTIVSGAPGIVVNGNCSAGSLTSRGGITSAGLITSSVAQGNVALQLNDGARINFSSGCLIYKNYGSNDFMFHTNASQVFTFHISGTGDVYVIDTVGSVGNSVNVTAPESVATAAELGVADDPERGVDVMKVMAALLLKVKKLEAEIATLKGRR